MSSHYVPHTKIPTLVFPTSTQASRHVALMIESLIRQNNSANRPTVLGLATGSTPVGLYRELIRLHKEANLDFSRVITFNLDEYFPMNKEDDHSYQLWMQETFFKHVNVQPQNAHIPDGTVSSHDVEDYCARYEQMIRRAGDIDLQILGIGRSGHIGFNEPGSTRHSRTRLATLDPVTRRDAAGDFFGEDNVPHQAVTMGVGTILEARKIVIMAFGEHKAPIVQRAVEGEMSEAITASFLQKHPDTTFILDQAAAGHLTPVRLPWVVGSVNWTPSLIRRAVIWLSLKVGKGLLKLSDDDFREHELYELLREYGPAHRLGRRVFDEMMNTICTSPGVRSQESGVRGQETGVRGQESGIRNQGTGASLAPDPRPLTPVLVFSPHPDDDVISMGGTIVRLVEQGHKVHIAYMTSGNIAVFDHDAWRFTDFVCGFNELFKIDTEHSETVKNRVQSFLRGKRPGQPDSKDLLDIKRLIRATEARAGALVCGVPPEQLEFMDLRFYRTGTIAKAPIHPQDIQDIINLLERLQPAQIYVAGEMSDPHGTHRVCANAVFDAVRAVRQEGQHFEVWLYRGAWEEWEPHEVERVVPLSPKDLDRKKAAVFRHQSQKDKAMFPGGHDTREFWQRAEDRNRNTAKVYDQLGLPEFYALEGFVQWRGD
ncbi:MAG: glucosamine-6-phosphate deaminase [Gemmataceae bacterium]|nr:glucosamine-6-phosphate deaminase [Gemmataceae bacterium]MCI0740541.1 glucosamine-6-phosphate deaminase [Gemmataceae bacterium]